MSVAVNLPGLDRLLGVVRRHDVPIETLPAGQCPPRAGDGLCGMPVDPLLAAAFARLGKLVIGRLGWETWLMLPCNDERNRFLLENEEWQGCFPHVFWPDHFRALMPFGGEGLYRYATAPELANPEGLQPVVRVDPYEDIFALPIASSVNCFFDAFSRYLEIMIQDPDYGIDGTSDVLFPYDVPEIIARDKALLGMIREGRFDRLMYERDKDGRRREDDIAHTRDWIGKVLGEEKER